MSTNIESLSTERRKFSPAKAFSAKAHIRSLTQYKKMYKESIEHPEKFWARVASELVWFTTWKKVLRWKSPDAKWFVGGKTNLSYNCLDRHLTSWRRNKAAILWEGENGDERVLTYSQLHREVCRFANGLKSLGVRKGDRIALYMGLTPELAIACLACARIGATHSVIFGGFSAEAIKDRVNDAKAKIIVTADGAYRRGAIIPLKQNVDEALAATPTVEHVVVVKRCGNDVEMKSNHVWWHELVATQSDVCVAEKLDSEHPLFILYTSGSTGKPKGILHTTGGYMVGTYLTTKYVFDLRDEDVYWCTADIGWVTGHSYVVYGPLLNGATTLMYEGAPNFPAPDRFWEIIEKYRVNIFYTAPTAIRAFIRWGDAHVTKHNLSSLRLLGTVGEPINPEAWMWYHSVVGKKNCPIVDTWWQTETGGIMITPLPGVTQTKPGSATLPFFGIDPDVVSKEGKPVGKNEGGYLVVKRPWPSMLRGIWGDPERFRKQYFSDVKMNTGVKEEYVYFTGDGARKDSDGYYWVMGRVDDVVNVAGHRLGTAEVESALVSHPAVAESAVVARPDELKGSALVAFVTLKSAHARGNGDLSALKNELKNHVAKEIGAIAKPDEIRFTDALPKTRSGKIMRRLLRELATGGSVKGDTTTLEDFSVLEKLREGEE